MLSIAQAVLALLPFSGAWNIQHPFTPPRVSKSIGIIGGGSGGLAALNALLDLPLSVRQDWTITLFEQRHGLGGVWLEDTSPPPEPPALPETPLYPRLKTNTPHPTMTYPGFPFPPGTPLFPLHDVIQKYHEDYATAYGLHPYIRLNHTVEAARWRGKGDDGWWDIDVRLRGASRTTRYSFDHLIVASGHNHYPYYPNISGSEAWEASSSAGSLKRKISHSLYYRHPEEYVNRTVLVIGGGASGRDAASQISEFAHETYHSFQHDPRSPLPPPDGPAISKPLVSHFTNSSVIFRDGSQVPSIDTVVLATGYDLHLPFLSPPYSDVVQESGPRGADQPNSTNSPSLTTNLRYLFPLHDHIFTLSPKTMPPERLSFVGEPILIANCPSDRAQALLIAHAIADPTVLPSREEMLQKLVKREEFLRERGYDPYYVGHRLLGDDEAQDYQNELVTYLKKKGKVADDGKDYVEEWRRFGRRQGSILRRAWTRVEDMGEAEQRRWLLGVETEEEWADLLYRLAAWQKEWEERMTISSAVDANSLYY